MTGPGGVAGHAGETEQTGRKQVVSSAYPLNGRKNTLSAVSQGDGRHRVGAETVAGSTPAPAHLNRRRKDE